METLTLIITIPLLLIIGVGLIWAIFATEPKPTPPWARQRSATSNYRRLVTIALWEAGEGSSFDELYKTVEKIYFMPDLADYNTGNKSLTELTRDILRLSEFHNIPEWELFHNIRLQLVNGLANDWDGAVANLYEGFAEMNTLNSLTQAEKE